MVKTKLFSVVVLISALILSSAFWSGCSAAGGGVDKGAKAPNFTLENLKGEKVSLSNFKDSKAVLLVFWATLFYAESHYIILKEKRYKLSCTYRPRRKCGCAVSSGRYSH